MLHVLPMKCVLYFYISTFRNVCAVHKMFFFVVYYYYRCCCCCCCCWPFDCWLDTLLSNNWIELLFHEQAFHLIIVIIIIISTLPSLFCCDSYNIMNDVIFKMWFLIIQGEHKVFPWLQIFITRKLRGIQKEHMLKCTDVL
jgi:hypothetical protein